MKTFFKRIFAYKFHIQPFFNPFIGLQISSMSDVLGVTETKRDVQLIVSLTSYRERFNDLPITLYSLLNQSIKPDRIILWLDEESEDMLNLPYEITQFVKNGLEIRFVKDVKSYTKAIYALDYFRESIIVTADDDVYYPSSWLEKLYLSYIANPQDIHVHRAHRVLLCGKEILPYEKWVKHVSEESASYNNFLTGVGGVLYPPFCFSKEVFRDDIFLKNAPNADDVWFWIMSLLNNRKIRVVKSHMKNIICSNIFTQLFSENLYKQNKKGGNDEQLKNLLKFYGQNILSKLS